MITNSLKIVALCAVFIISAASCKPGLTQPPKPATVLIYQPCSNIHKPGTFEDVKFKTTIRVKTTDASDNIVTYPGGTIVNTQSSTSASPDILYGTEYTLQQPSGATKFLLDVLLDTRECGWPIPGTAWSKGEISWEYTSPQHTYPYNAVVPESYFSVLSKNEC